MSKHHHEHPATEETVTPVTETPETIETSDVVDSGEAAETPDPVFGITQLAEKMGLQARRVRQLLRKAGIQRTGRLYGWNSEEEIDEVASKLEELKAAAKEATEASGDAPEASAEAKPKRSRKKASKAEPIAQDPELSELEEIMEG